jgi:hypothetical protein
MRFWFEIFNISSPRRAATQEDGPDFRVGAIRIASRYVCVIRLGDISSMFIGLCEQVTQSVEALLPWGAAIGDPLLR